MLGSLLASAFAACKPGETNSQTSNSAASAAEVIVCMTPSNEPAAGFDPFFSWGAGGHCHEPLIQSTLITTTVDMLFENDLATGYEVSNDGMKWVFSIRNDVSFTDGVPLTASDVAFTINGIKASAGSEVDLSMIKQALAKDDSTVEISMERPCNALLYTLATIGIVPEHAHRDSYGANPIGSGRYQLEQWDRGQQVILKANPDYYGVAPLIQRVIVVFLEEDAAFAAARAGRVDIASTSAIFSNQVIDGYDIFACKSVDSRGISLPVFSPGKTRKEGGRSYEVGNSVTSDILVRRALNYAVDRETMINNVINGYGSEAYSVSDGMPWASGNMKVSTSVEEARRILTNGGWIEGANGIRVKEGIKASINLCYPAYDSLRQSLANEFSNQARRIGIEVQVVGLGWDDIYPRQYKDPILWGWGSNSPMELYSIYHSKGQNNFSCYENATTDAYINEALATSNIEDSFLLWQQAQWDGTKGVAPQGAATWIWLANIDHLYFKRKNLIVAEQKLHPHGHGWSLVNNIDLWSWL